MNRNPWRRLSSSQIYDNPWIFVREDKVVNPSDGDGVHFPYPETDMTGVI